MARGTRTRQPSTAVETFNSDPAGRVSPMQDFDHRRIRWSVRRIDGVRAALPTMISDANYSLRQTTTLVCHHRCARHSQDRESTVEACWPALSRKLATDRITIRIAIPPSGSGREPLLATMSCRLDAFCCERERWSVWVVWLVVDHRYRQSEMIECGNHVCSRHPGCIIGIATPK